MEIGKWKEVVLAGGFSEEWGYVCPECGCIVSDKSRLGFRYIAGNQKMNYCPNCGTRLYGEPDKEQEPFSAKAPPKIVAFKFSVYDDRLFCTVRMKWKGEDIGLTVSTDIADLVERLALQDYFHMEETE
jgi:hypothetical protein